MHHKGPIDVTHSQPSEWSPRQSVAVTARESPCSGKRAFAPLTLLIIGIALLARPVAATEPSACFGTTSAGQLENGWKLPSEGPNFSAYSTLGRVLGRTYVHSTVYDIVLEAYAHTAKTIPDAVFVYGETGFRQGGKFKPHKTHQNGLSVDFMVPIRDGQGRSVPLPTNVMTKWGYDLEFDESGHLNDWQIDYQAMAEHLYQLQQASRRRGVEIWRVIFDPKLQPMLKESPRWQYLKDNIAFSTKPSWVRHDEHYHVDFDVACEPATE
jgi:penicillin-insensitive murein endopeptidase